MLTSKEIDKVMALKRALGHNPISVSCDQRSPVRHADIPKKKRRKKKAMRRR